MHAAHDSLRIAEAVDRGARPAPVIELCARCADMYRELVAITAALPLAALPARRRGFTLTAHDAHRLRTQGWRGWWWHIWSGHDRVTKPLAVGFTTLGLAGLLITTVPGLLSMSSSTGAAPVIELGAAGAAASAPPKLGARPTPPPRDVVSEVAAEAPSTLVVSGGLLGVGGSLFAMRWITRSERRVR